MLTFADFNEEPVYKELIQQFGGTNVTFDEARQEFQAFHHQMQDNLFHYLKLYEFCQIYPMDPYCGDCETNCSSRIALYYDPEDQTCECVPERRKECSYHWWLLGEYCVPQDRCELHVEAHPCPEGIHGSVCRIPVCLPKHGRKG